MTTITETAAIAGRLGDMDCSVDLESNYDLAPHEREAILAKAQQPSEFESHPAYIAAMKATEGMTLEEKQAFHFRLLEEAHDAK